MKTYSRPQIHIVDLQTKGMFADRPLALSMLNGDADKNGEVLSTGRRGVWGNIWIEDPLDEE